MAGLLLIGITVAITLMLTLNSYAYAWHVNLGIDSNKAAELYKANPNDPAIFQWKNSLQLAINDMNKCFNIESAISCKSLISSITSDCKSHPNELLACNDTRLAEYPLILMNAEEAKKKDEEAKKQAEEQRVKNLTVAYSASLKETKARLTIDRCITSSNPISKFEVTDKFCRGELDSLREDCETVYPPYNYCKDEQFVGYLDELTQPKTKLGRTGCLGTLLTTTDGGQICVKSNR